jgi:hypothetical protein
MFTDKNKGSLSLSTQRRGAVVRSKKNSRSFDIAQDDSHVNEMVTSPLVAQFKIKKGGK